MHIITWGAVRAFIGKHPESQASMRAWFDILASRQFKGFDDLRSVFPAVDRVRLESGHERFIFNVAGNRYRVICSIHFNRAKVYIRFVLTHAEYDKGAWKNE